MSWSRLIFSRQWAFPTTALRNWRLPRARRTLRTTKRSLWKWTVFNCSRLESPERTVLAIGNCISLIHWMFRNLIAFFSGTTVRDSSRRPFGLRFSWDLWLLPCWLGLFPCWLMSKAQIDLTTPKEKRSLCLLLINFRPCKFGFLFNLEWFRNF